MKQYALKKMKKTLSKEKKKRKRKEKKRKWYLLYSLNQVDSLENKGHYICTFYNLFHYRTLLQVLYRQRHRHKLKRRLIIKKHNETDSFFKMKWLIVSERILK